MSYFRHPRAHQTVLFGIAFSGSKKPPSFTSLCRAVAGLPVRRSAYMTVRERIDFIIIVLLFGVLVGA